MKDFAGECWHRQGNSLFRIDGLKEGGRNEKKCRSPAHISTLLCPCVGSLGWLVGWLSVGGFSPPFRVTSLCFSRERKQRQAKAKQGRKEGRKESGEERKKESRRRGSLSAWSGGRWPRRARNNREIQSERERAWERYVQYIYCNTRRWSWRGWISASISIEWPIEPTFLLHPPHSMCTVFSMWQRERESYSIPPSFLAYSKEEMKRKMKSNSRNWIFLISATASIITCVIVWSRSWVVKYTHTNIRTYTAIVIA